MKKMNVYGLVRSSKEGEMPDKAQDQINEMLGEVTEPEDVTEADAEAETLEETSGVDTEEKVNESTTADEEGSEGEEESDEEEVSEGSEEEGESTEGDTVGEGQETEEGSGESSEKPAEEPNIVETQRDMINQMSGLLLRHGIRLPGMTQGDTPQVPQPAPVPEQAPTQSQPMSFEQFQILDDNVDFDDVTSDRASYEAAQRAMLSRYHNYIVQQFTATLPSIVASQVRQVRTLDKAVEAFYEDNDDLVSVRPTVGAIADQVVAENPDWSLDRVLGEAAVRTRKTLGFPDPTKATPKKVVKPSFAKSKGSNRKPKPKVSRLQQDIDDLL
jgi:hypothetical protein